MVFTVFKKSFLYFFALNFPYNVIIKSDIYIDILKIPYYTDKIITFFYIFRLLVQPIKFIGTNQDCPDLDNYLPDFQLTNSWLRKTLYFAHFMLYWGMPCLWIRFTCLASNHPRRWQQFQQFYSDLTTKFRIGNQLERNHYRLQVFVIRLGALIAVQMIIFFEIIYFINLWVRVLRVQSYFAWTVQFFWTINFALVYNYMGLWISILTTLFFTNLFYSIYKTQNLNQKFNYWIKRLQTTDKFFKSTISLRKQDLLLKTLAQFASHAQEVQYFNDLLTFDQGVTLSMTAMHACTDIFMIIYPFDLVLNQTFLFIFFISLPIPFLLMPCLFGQKLINQHTEMRKKIYKLHSLIQAHKLKRKLQSSLILFGHQPYALQLDILRSAEYSHYTLVKVAKRKKI